MDVGIFRKRRNESEPLIPVTPDHFFQNGRPFSQAVGDNFFAARAVAKTHDRFAHDHFVTAIANSDDEKREDWRFANLRENERTAW